MSGKRKRRPEVLGVVIPDDPQAIRCAKCGAMPLEACRGRLYGKMTAHAARQDRWLRNRRENVFAIEAGISDDLDPYERRAIIKARYAELERLTKRALRRHGLTPIGGS